MAKGTVANISNDKLLGVFSKRGLAFGFLLWAVMFSIGLMLRLERDAGLINPLTMKLLLICGGSGLAFIFYRLLRSQGFLHRAIAHSFMLVNSLLDIVILMGIFQRNMVEWLGSVFIFYIVVFYGLYYLLRKPLPRR